MILLFMNKDFWNFRWTYLRSGACFCNVNQSQIEISPNSAILTKRMKILKFYKTLPYLQTQCQSISDWNFTEFGDTHKAAENFNPREETSRSLQWSCYSWTKIFETSLELICDQVLVFLFWTARGVSIQPWSKLLGQQRNSWSKWGIFVLPSTRGGAFSRLISLRVSRCFDQGCS